MVDIPTLDIEDYDPDLNEEQETVEDKSGGALTYAIVGAGQGGGRMAKAFTIWVTQRPSLWIQPALTLMV